MGGILKAEWLSSCFWEPSECSSLHSCNNNTFRAWELLYVLDVPQTPLCRHKRILWDIQGRACVSVVVSGAMFGSVAAAPDVTRLCRSVEDSSTHPKEEGTSAAGWRGRRDCCSETEMWSPPPLPCGVVWHTAYCEKSELSRDCTEITWVWCCELFFYCFCCTLLIIFNSLSQR